MLGEYLGVYSAKIRVGGLPRGPQSRGAPPRAHPEGLWGPRESSDPLPKSSGCLLVQENSSRKFYSVWTPFDIPFLRNTEIGKKTGIWAGPPVNRLVPKNDIKVYNKTS